MPTPAIKEFAAQFASLAIIVIGWEFTACVMDTSALPTATQALATLSKIITTGEAFGPLGSTLLRTTLGFALGFFLGGLYGIFAALSRTFATVTAWPLQIAIFTPTLILIFLFLISFGRSNVTVIVLIGIVVAPVVGVYIRDALGDFDPELEGMAFSFKVPLAQRIAGMYLPFLIPPMLAAGRIGFTLAWKVAFLSEIFGFPNGLGWQVRNSYEIYDVSALLGWLILFILTLIAVEQFTRLVERRVVKW